MIQPFLWCDNTTLAKIIITPKDWPQKRLKANILERPIPNGKVRITPTGATGKRLETFHQNVLRGLHHNLKILNSSNSFGRNSFKCGSDGFLWHKI